MRKMYGEMKLKTDGSIQKQHQICVTRLNGFRDVKKAGHEPNSLHVYACVSVPKQLSHTVAYYLRCIKMNVA